MKSISAGETVGPAVAEWQKKATPEDMKNLYALFLQKIEEDKNSTENKQLKCKISEISLDGVIKFEFSKKAHIPGIIKQESDSESRRMLGEPEKVTLSEIDVSRDIMDFTFISQEEVDYSKLVYYLEIVSWTEDNFELRINFTNPLIVSNGITEDLVVCRLKNRKLFVAKDTNQMIEKSSLVIVKAFPR